LKDGRETSVAKFVLLDAFVSINSVDLSDHVKKVTFDYKADEVDVSSMGTNTTHSRLGGLLDWTAQVEFFNDFAAASVDATLFPLVGTTVAIEVRPVKTGGRTATNPGYAGNALVASHSPLSGDVGTAAMSTVNLVANSALTRLIA
jgi:hypothetical protein